MINEVLTKSTPAGEWIKDFVDSDNPKFAGKSAAKRKQMALAAYYSKQEESYAGSQNSTAEVDMNEDHLVHVSDGSKYDEVPHPKDIEHVKTGAMHHGGKWDSHSDKGAFFKFKSKEDAENFKRHVDKCPHRSCYADLSEAVEYKGMGTDVVDKKKKLNPQPNFTTDKKTVKDFKEAKELDKACWKGYKAIGLKNKNGRQVPNCVPEEKELEEGKVYDPFSKKMVARKPIKVQAGGGATRNGVPVETGPSKYKTLRQAYDAATAGQTVTPKQKLNKEGYDHGPIDRDAKVAVGHKAAVLAGSGLDSGKHGTIVGSSKERTGDMWHIKTSSGDIVKMHKHRVAKLKEGVELIAKHEVKADAPHKSGGHVILTKSSNKWHVLHNKKSSPEAKDLHRSKLLHSYADEKEARAKFKELHEEQIDEISKSTLMRYIPKASRDVGSHTYAGKEAGEWAAHYTRAGDWAAADKQSKKSYADFKKANKRIAGIDTATKKLGTQKEEVELDEAIAKKLPVQHAVDAVHKTLGPKSATRFLSHLSPGSEKHTSWDKVNDALVKQGVQTHHIASIAQKTSRMNEEVIDESRGHKVLATFFKNREVAQRSYQGNPAKDAEVAQGGGSPADQGIAAAKADYKKMNKENVNPALMAILKKRQEAQKKKQEDKKKVNEATAPAVHAAEPKKTKSTPKEYKKAPIPGTKRVAHAKPDDNEVGGGTSTRIQEDQYTSEYKIKSFVDPVTGENKTRKIRPHRINFKASKMHGEPAQQDAPGDYGIKEGFDDYSSIAKELVKRYGKNVTAQHVKDFAGERDTHKGLDHAEVMHHVKKLSEGDKVYDEKWKTVNFKDFTKGAK